MMLHRKSVALSSREGFNAAPAAKRALASRRRFLLGSAAALAAGLTASATAHAQPVGVAVPAPAEVVDWLKATALPLATAEPGGSSADLAPFRAVIGQARLVGLGEATHGTRDFFQLKHRLIAYCVAELGFTVIGFEAEYGRTLAVNDYVLHGKGTAGDVVAGMGFWTWDTEEVVALVEWVRGWNAAHERKVAFYGFDMQGCAAATLHLLAYLARVAPAAAAQFEPQLAPLASELQAHSALAEPALAAMREQIKAALALFDSERAAWIGLTGARDWHLARLGAVTIEQDLESRRVDDADGRGGFEHRDRCMAANIGALLVIEGPDARAVLWAHNGHVQKGGYVALKSMGTLLAAEYGADFVTFGFAFDRGAFRARDERGELVSFTVGPAPDFYLDAALARVGLPLLALDLRKVPQASPAAKWLDKKPPQRDIGALFIPARAAEFALRADPRALWNVLLFVEKTAASRENRAHTPLPPDVVGDLVHDRPTNLVLAGTGPVPDGWQLRNPSLAAYTVATADDPALARGKAARLTRDAGSLPWGDVVLMQAFPAAPWVGRRLIFKAAMRAQAAAPGTGASIAVMAFAKPRQEGNGAQPLLAFQPGGPVRTADWTQRSATADIPADTDMIAIILMLTGSGSARFGDLDIAVAETPAKTPAATSSLHAPAQGKEAVPLPLVQGPALMRQPIVRP